MSIQLIQQYYAQVEKIIRYGGSRNEATLRKAFQDLLEAYALSKNLLLVPEVELRTRGGKRVIPDGTLKDALRQDWGYWESKDEKDDLTAEIAAKFAKGYPSTNILFEDTQNAVLYQNGEEIMRADFKDASALDAILTRFCGYEPQEVTAFHRAIEQFNADVPKLAEELREIIDEQSAENAVFLKALGEFLELCKKAINPRVEIADAREMLIQHILTEDIFMTVFDDPQFHRENAIARKLQEVIATFYHGATQHKIHERIAPYYETINARAAQIYNHHEKQKFLKALYEKFYRAYNPKAADRLGIIYTPDEIVRFMIHAADALTFKHFGKTLGDADVDFLDPFTGTGTFVTELIEYLPENQLPHKYRNEIHCNEVAILPYYVANLNIEYTYKQKMGEYVPFENICFMDTLDNQGFTKSGQHQMDFLGMVDENTERIERQNQRKISIIMSNPPYNAWQENFNLHNPNRPYQEVDKRIKETYLKSGTAQNQIALYDMYVRCVRWASDRLDQNGIVAFVSNNSFLDARTYDGFRKVVADEFNHIYVIDLKGNARTSGEQRRREGGNVFSDEIRVGVAIYFLVRKLGEKGCKIHYNAISDYARGEDKKAYLRDNAVADLKFEAIHPDKKHNWLNLTDNDWDGLLPLVGEDKSVFGLFSNGIKTGRDEWVYDLSKPALETKMRFFVGVYEKTRADKNYSDKLQIKWDSDLESYRERGLAIKFDKRRIVRGFYRPFVKAYLYFDKSVNGRTYQLSHIFPNAQSDNLAIWWKTGEDRPQFALAVNSISDVLPAGGSQCLPLYRYADDGERIDNITNWAVEQFRARYGRGDVVSPTKPTKGGITPPLQKIDIFHYIYAVLHHPAYREKYALNLKREFPRIPFYDDFWQWANWGKQLLDLHLNYEQAKPFALKRVETLHATSLRNQQKPRLLVRKETGVIEIDTLTILSGVPSQAWEYRLGTYSALEWILERYKERTPKDPTIREKFNTYKFADYKDHVIDLLKRVCTVSVETMKIIEQMPK